VIGLLGITQALNLLTPGRGYRHTFRRLEVYPTTDANCISPGQVTPVAVSIETHHRTNANYEARDNNIVNINCIFLRTTQDVARPNVPGLERQRIGGISICEGSGGVIPDSLQCPRGSHALRRDFDGGIHQ